ncbi:MAG: type III-A CRISPR-associated RAMP protein Csm3, partial [Nitrospirae bacterium]
EQKKECENILKLFGTSGADQGEEDLGPTRVSFADCPLSKNWKEKAYEQHLPLTEVKPENRINRIKGTAEHPRFTERVPAGAEFDFTVTLKILEESEEEELKILLLEGLKLLQMDALGGNGSRGYGRIEFVFEDEDTKKEFDEINPFSGATR